jgi:hypothetical protein
MKLTFLTLVFAFAGAVLQAQSTGYMGRRFVLNYGFHASPITFGSSANNTTLIGNGGSAETGVFALNAIHEGSLEFAMSSKWMMNFSVRYYKTTYDNAQDLNVSVYDSYYGYYDSYSGRPEGYYNIRGLSYTLYFKYFGSRYVAPWGRYVMFGPVINTVKTTYDPAVMYLQNAYYNYNGSTYTKIKDFGAAEQDFKGFNFMLGWGRSRIIANRIVVDYGCNFQLLSLLSVPFELEGEDDLPLISSSRLDNHNYIELTNKKRVRGVNRFNVFIKVGILLF